MTNRLAVASCFAVGTFAVAPAVPAQAAHPAQPRVRITEPPVRIEVRAGRMTAVGAARPLGLGHSIAIDVTQRVRGGLALWLMAETSPLDGRRVGITDGPETGSHYVAVGVAHSLVPRHFRPERLDVSTALGIGVRRFVVLDYFVNGRDASGDPAGFARAGAVHVRPMASAIVRTDIRVVRQLAVSVTTGVHATLLGRHVTRPLTNLGPDLSPFRTMYTVPLGFGLAYRF